MTPVPTEPQILKKMMRCFLDMFSMDKGNLIMNMMTNSNWGVENTIWTYIYKDMPQRNFDTASSIFAFVDKKMKDTDWTEENTDALTQAVFEKPKITNKILEAMCQVTQVEYRSKEKEIDFLRLLEQLAKIGLEGSTFICEKVK